MKVHMVNDPKADGIELGKHRYLNDIEAICNVSHVGGLFLTRDWNNVDCANCRKKMTGDTKSKNDRI